MLSKEERARQFLPFDALNGFRKALKEKEIEYVDKIELSDDQIEQISEKLNMLAVNEEITVMYYFNRQYKEYTGKVSKIDLVRKKLILDDVTINFADILKLEIA